MEERLLRTQPVCGRTEKSPLKQQQPRKRDFALKYFKPVEGQSENPDRNGKNLPAPRVQPRTNGESVAFAEPTAKISVPKVPLRPPLPSPGAEAALNLERALERLQDELAWCRLQQSSSSSNNSVAERLLEVESLLWPIIQTFVETGKSSPRTLLCAKRVLQELEKLEPEILRLAKGKLTLISPSQNKSLPWKSQNFSSGAQQQESRFLNRWYNEIKRGVDNCFIDLLERVAQSGNVDQILAQATLAAEGLAVVKDLKMYFPDHYEFPAYVRHLYIGKFVEVGHKLSARAGEMDMDTIRKVLEWAAKLKLQVVELGVAENLASVPLEYGALNPVMDEYERKAAKFTEEYLSRLLESEGLRLVEESRQKLRTPVPVEIFKLLYGQVEVAGNTGNSLLLLRVSRVLASAVAKVQDQQLKLLQGQQGKGGETIKLFFAVMNDSFMSRNHMSDLATDVLRKLDQIHREDLDFEGIKEGFVDLARRACRMGVAQIFRREAGLSLRSGVTREFRVNVHTLTDVLKSWLRPDAFKLSVQVLFEHVVVACVEELVHEVGLLDEARLDQLDKDTASIEDFFSKHLGAELLQDRLKLLDQVRDIACADSMEWAVVCYKELLDSSWPECSPLLIEKLMTNRGCFKRSEIRSAIEECKEAQEEQALTRKNARNPSFLKPGIEERRWLTTTTW